MYRPIFAALVLLFGCEQLPQEGTAIVSTELTPQDIEYLKSISHTWAEAVLGGCDLDEQLSVYEDDAIRLVDSVPLIGKEAMRQHLASLPCEIAEFEVTNQKVDGSGDLAYIWDNFIIRSSGDSSMIVEGYWLGVAKKQDDGTWKVVIDMGRRSDSAIEM